MAELIPLEDLAVNDRYWLGRARAIFDGSIPASDEAAGRLCSSLVWFWTIYTSVALVGIALSNRQLGVWQTLVVVAPVVVLIVAYLVATWTLLPVAMEFDPRIPDEVRTAYVDTVNRKRRRLQWASALTVAGGATVAVAAATVALLPPQTQTRFTAMFDATDRAVIVSGQLPPGTEVLVRAVDRTPGRPTSSVPVVAIAASSSGSFDGRLPLTTTGREYEVIAQWTEPTGSRTWSRTVRT